MRFAIALVLCFPVLAFAQLNDVTQTPNTENVGIKKSLSEQVGAGQGDIMTPDSSAFIASRDPFRSVARGRQLFQRKFTHAQGLGPRTGDGMGDIETDGSLGAGLVDSCAGCHGRPRGTAGSGGNVFTRPDSRDAPHLFGLGLQEMLADEMTTTLRAIEANAKQDADNAGSAQTRPLMAKGINFGTITAFPGGSVDTSGVEGVNPDLRVRPFFAEGSTISIREFIVGAFNAEMGLECPDPVLVTASSGGSAFTASGLFLDGSLDSIEAPPVTSAMEDSDGDGVVNEIDPALVDHMEVYLFNYFKPGRYRRTLGALYGRFFMSQLGCNSCHRPNLVVNQDRRLADVETRYNPVDGVFNHLFAEATPLFTQFDDGSGFPTIKSAELNPFVVRNFYADLKRHDVGAGFYERNFDGTFQTEFVTEPLWGVATTAPYGHDGRSINLREVILRHGGEAQAARNNFATAGGFVQGTVIDFLNTLVLFGPPDTASNLDPGDPTNPDFPQRGHGSIDLSVLFNDPNDKE